MPRSQISPQKKHVLFTPSTTTTVGENILLIIQSLSPQSEAQVQEKENIYLLRTRFSKVYNGHKIVPILNRLLANYLKASSTGDQLFIHWLEGKTINTVMEAKDCQQINDFLKSGKSSEEEAAAASSDLTPLPLERQLSQLNELSESAEPLTVIDNASAQTARRLSIL